MSIINCFYILEEIQKNVTNKMNIISSIEKQKLPQASHVIDTPTTLTTSGKTNCLNNRHISNKLPTKIRITWG